jgi:hypothetical protein
MSSGGAWVQVQARAPATALAKAPPGASALDQEPVLVLELAPDQASGRALVQDYPLALGLAMARDEAGLLAQMQDPVSVEATCRTIARGRSPDCSHGQDRTWNCL